MSGHVTRLMSQRVISNASGHRAAGRGGPDGGLCCQPGSPRRMAGRIAESRMAGQRAGRPASALLLSPWVLIPTLIDRQGADRHGQRPDQPGTDGL